MTPEQKVIEQTIKWIKEVVIGCNFCPFASAVVKKNAVLYLSAKANLNTIPIAMSILKKAIKKLDEDENIETCFVIFPDGFGNFMDYLYLVDETEHYLQSQNYQGVYQIASFHPQYCFSGSNEDDAANYTNRSPHPMLHILRESSIDKALKNYNHPELIPERNIDFARKKGIVYMKMLRDACL